MGKSPFSEEMKQEQPVKVNKPKKKLKVKTKMTNNYANIQRNKQIFNTITKNNQFKQSTMLTKGKTFSKSSRDLESMMNHIELKDIDDSKPENIGRSSSMGSNQINFGASTPKGNVSTGKANKTKPRIKRRKSFSLGVGY